MEIYWTHIEFKYLPGSEHFGECEGGFVYAFVQAKDVRDALPRFLDEMKANKFGTMNVDHVSMYDSIPWETDEDQKKYDALAEKAKGTTNVILDTISAYYKR